MIRDEQGSMSAFLAMLFLVFLLLISVCVEGIYMYTARGKAMGIYMSGLSHTKGNYQKELDRLIENITKEGKVPRLFLHSCCAPCSSHCIEYLSDYFHITVFYYNPNISAEEEYRKRVEEQKRFISEFPAKYKVSFIEGDYDTKEFYDIAKGYEQCREGGERCFRCYELRLKKTCETAKAGGFDYFTTTLTICLLYTSPSPRDTR